MSLFKEFSVLFPYLQSVRRLENYIAFDISLPKTWKLPKKYVEEDKVIEQESKIESDTLSYMDFEDLLTGKHRGKRGRYNPGEPSNDHHGHDDEHPDEDAECVVPARDVEAPGHH